MNPFSTFGFERLFGSPENGASLIDFLQQLPGLSAVERISFISPADLFEASDSGDAVFDLHCQDAGGIPLKIQVQLLVSENWWEKSLAYAYLSDYHEYVANAGSYPSYCLAILISDTACCPLKYIDEAWLWRFACTFSGTCMPDARFHFIYLEPARFFAAQPLADQTFTTRPLGNPSLGNPSLGTQSLGTRPLGTRPLGGHRIGNQPLADLAAESPAPNRLHQWMYLLGNLPLLHENGPMAQDPLFYPLIKSASLANLQPHELDAYHHSQNTFFHPPTP